MAPACGHDDPPEDGQVSHASWVALSRRSPMTIEQAVMKTAHCLPVVWVFVRGLFTRGLTLTSLSDEKTIIDNADFVHYDRRCDGLKCVIVGGESLCR